MTAHRHYDKAPITEAIIDLRVRPRAELSLEELDQLQSGEVRYSQRELLFEAHGLIEVRPGGAASASARQEQHGFRFKSDDGKDIWQARKNGFAFSRLAPYQDWRVFRDEARRLWDIYRGRVKPDRLIRLAVRYINRIDIPQPGVDLKQFFRTSPEVSPELPQQLSGFFMQLRIAQDDLPGHLLLNQTIVPPPNPSTVSVVLDIDLFGDQGIPEDEPKVWDYFERLHERKNEVFEACITDQARELFY